MLVPEILIVIILGLVLGSFATAMIYRIPRGHPWAFATKGHAPEDITAYRSACTHCHTKLGVADLVPVFSWLFSRGRCRHCGSAIGAVYPLTETGVVIACLLVYFSFGLSVYSGFLWVLLPFLTALLVIDLERLILPNQLVLIVGGLGLAAIGAQTLILNSMGLDEAWARILAALIFAAFAGGVGCCMSKMLKKQALGYGDIKFFAVAGFWLGLEQFPWFCMLSGLFGVVFSLLWQRLKGESVFPFGPALIVSLFILLLFDGSLLS